MGGNPYRRTEMDVLLEKMIVLLPSTYHSFHSTISSPDVESLCDDGAAKATAGPKLPSAFVVEWSWSR